jgi:predicted nucleic acid-binding protein
LGLNEDLGSGAVAVDTAVFIYFIEEEPRYLPLIAPLFEEADSGKRELVTSAVTLLEVLVVPYRAGDVQLAERYELLLTRSRGVRMVDVTRDQLRAAAQLRAATGMKTPDALQIASALSAECRTFLTDDRGLPTVPGLQIVQLSSYLERED